MIEISWLFYLCNTFCQVADIYYLYERKKKTNKNNYHKNNRRPMQEIN